MAKYHGMEELAPCDVVSRAIMNEMELTGAPSVLLDATHLPSDFIRSRFSKIYQFCYQFGMDITTDVIPVRSGAHFMDGRCPHKPKRRNKPSGGFMLVERLPAPAFTERIG